MARNTSILLGDHFLEFIQQQVASGRYASTSEVVREGLRLLEAQERELDWLRAQIEPAHRQVLKGKVTEDSDELWEEMERRVEERALARERTRSDVTA